MLLAGVDPVQIALKGGGDPILAAGVTDIFAIRNLPVSGILRATLPFSVGSSVQQSCNEDQQSFGRPSLYRLRLLDSTAAPRMACEKAEKKS